MRGWRTVVTVLIGLLAVSVLAQEGGAGAPAGQQAPPAPGGAAFAAMRDAMTFEKLDADKDGKVTLDEYLAAWAEVGKARFKAVDANGDGVVTKEEMEKARETMRARFGAGGGAAGQGQGRGRGPGDRPRFRGQRGDAPGAGAPRGDQR